MNGIHRVPAPRKPAADHDVSPLGGRVVVGVDGSAASVGALTWALKYASEHDCAVEVVTAWPVAAPVFVHEVPGHFCEARWSAVQAQARAIAHALSLVEAPPRYSTRMENAVPLEALVAAARHGDLLVLGSDRADPELLGAGTSTGNLPLTVRVQREADGPVLLISTDRVAVDS